MNDLIVIEQLPLIKERLKDFKSEIEKEVDEAKNLACTAESVRFVKDVRAKLNAKKTMYEDRRKEVKQAILAPYMEFEKVYKECVTTPLSEADTALKIKIDDVESIVKQEKIDKAQAYFNEYLCSVDIDFIAFDDVGLKIGVSSTLKSLKDSCKNYIDKIKAEVTAIETMDYADEIFIEYRKDFQIDKSILTVRYRKEELKKIENIKAEMCGQKQADIERVDNVKKLSAPILMPPQENGSVVQKSLYNRRQHEEGTFSQNHITHKEVNTVEKQYKMSFKVNGTIEQLKDLKQFLIDNEIQFENLGDKL